MAKQAIAIIAALPLVLTAPVWADDADVVSSARSLFDLSLDELLQVEVVITTDKPEQERRVFGSVHKITAQDWQLSGDNMVFEPLDHLPGVDTHLSVGGSTTFSIRGYTGGASSSRGKALLFDGVPLNGFAFATSLYSKSTLPTNLLASMELVKGPISSFYGPDAFHGALMLLPWYAEGNYIEGSVSFGSQSDKEINARASYQLSEQLQSVTNINHFSQSDAELYASNAGRSFENGYDTLTLNQSFYSSWGQFSVLYHEGESTDFYDIFSPATSSEIDHTETRLYYYKHQLELTEHWTLKPVVWQHDSEFDLVWNDRRQYQSWHDRQQGAKLHLDWLPQGHQLKFGLEFISSEVTDAKVHQVGQPPVDGATKGMSRDISTAFIHYQTELLTDSLLLDVGLRFDHFSNTDADELSPKLGLIWLVNPQHTIKLLFGEGYRAPAAGEITGSSAFLGSDDLEGEQLASYELIYLFQHEHVKWHATLFFNEWDNAIRVAVTPESEQQGKDGQFINSGANESYGVETELMYLFEQLNLMTFAQAAYVRSENTDIDADYQMFPRLKLSAGVRYNVANWRFSLEQLSKFNRKETGAPGAADLPDLHRTDISAHYYFDMASLSLTVENLWDKDNVEPGIWNVVGGYQQSGREAKLKLHITY